MNGQEGTRRLIGFNLILGPLLFVLGGFAAYFGGIALGHIVAAILIGIGAYMARDYISPEGHVSKAAALGANSAALLMSGLQLIGGNFQRIDTFAENSGDTAVFLGIVSPLLPVGILCFTLYTLIMSRK